MKLLLDTHLLVWAMSEPNRLSARARATIEDSRNDLYFSAASIWELAIKASVRRRDLGTDPSELREALLAVNYVEVSVTSAHAVLVRSLRPIHKDPFDRILVAQALAEGFTLLTVDDHVARYDDSIVKV